MSKKRVVIAGAAGYVAHQMLPDFRKQYDLVLLDAQNKNRWGEVVEGVEIVDLTNHDLAKYAHHFEGADAVVSLARRPRLDDPIETYDVEDPNIRLNYNVMRAAYEGGCERFVYASSNHAADWYERYLIHERKMENLDPYKIPLSDNFYGWSKASSEHMGFLFASGAFGRKMGFVGVRIGSPSEVHSDRFKGDVRNLKRHLGSYISPRDITQLFSKAIDATDIENEHGIPWQIVYGISDNTRAYWSLSNARQVLGYRPEDDSETRYADYVREFIVEASETGRVGESRPLSKH